MPSHERTSARTPTYFQKNRNRNKDHLERPHPEEPEPEQGPLTCRFFGGACTRISRCLFPWLWGACRRGTGVPVATGSGHRSGLSRPTPSGTGCCARARKWAGVPMPPTSAPLRRRWPCSFATRCPPLLVHSNSPPACCCCCYCPWCWSSYRTRPSFQLYSACSHLLPAAEIH